MIEEILKNCETKDEVKGNAIKYYGYVKEFMKLTDYNKHYSRTSTEDLYHCAESFAYDVMNGMEYNDVKKKYFPDVISQVQK